MPHAPPGQAGTRLDGRAARTRRQPLDPALGPQPRHHPDQVRHLKPGTPPERDDAVTRGILLDTLAASTALASRMLLVAV